MSRLFYHLDRSLENHDFFIYKVRALKLPESKFSLEFSVMFPVLGLASPDTIAQQMKGTEKHQLFFFFSSFEKSDGPVGWGGWSMVQFSPTRPLTWALSGFLHRAGGI